MALDFTRPVPMFIGPVLRATLLLPKEVSALTGTLLGPFTHLVLELYDVAVRQEWPTPANVRPRV